MGVLSSILLWPLAPIRGVVSLGQVIAEQAEQELRNPTSARHDLEAAEAAHRDGEISAAELERVQQLVLDRMAGRQGGLELPTPPNERKG